MYILVDLTCIYVQISTTFNMYILLDLIIRLFFVLIYRRFHFKYSSFVTLR